MLRNLFIAITLWCFAAPALSAEVALRHIPNAQKVGEGRLSVLFWDVYDVTLYGPAGSYDENKPFALSIRYMREIEGKDIAERSAREIHGQGFIDEAKLVRWREQMEAIFPDVKNGSTLSAVFIPRQKTLFYEGNKQIGIIKDAAFTRWFSRIWLGEKTSEPELRRRLLGLS